VNTFTSVPPTLRFGVFELDPRAGELRKKGMKIKLQGQPVEILVMLLQRPGEIVTRDELQKKLWPADTFVDFEQGLNNAMKRLRAALDDDAESPHFIETLPRRGYRFVGSLNGAAYLPVAEVKPTGRQGPALRWASFGLLAFITMVAVLLGLNVRGWRDRLLAPEPKLQIQALAVLPLANLSGDPEQDYFADGMTEALITELGKVSSPRIISRQSVMQYQGSKKSLQEIARELKVDAVLEGSVERSGDRVRVTIHLSQALPERQLWTQEYNRGIRDALSLQSEIARAVADEIQVKLTPEERNHLASGRSVNPDAQDNFLRAWYFANKGDAQRAIAHFKTAIEEDPTFAPAYTELAMTYYWQGSGDYPNGGSSTRETLPLAKATVTKALQLDPSQARAHLALGLILLTSEWNWRRAEDQYRLALELNPNCGDCRFLYGILMAALGRSDEALAQINQAIELDPFSDNYRGMLAAVAFFTRQYDLCIKLSENLSDDQIMVTGMCYAKKGMYPEAIAYSERAVARPGGRQTNDLGRLAQVYGFAGRKSETRKIIGELKERSRHQYVFPSALGDAYLGLGDRNQSITWFERAYEEQEPGIMFLNVARNLDPLRSEPRFQALLRRMNFPP
jgi:TolB-like protein/DNA-binding winged helix-turn-helix (wHTH) protein/Tfp pilus assembly protein PilF